MRTWVIGVNWYMNDYIRLMFNYAQSDLSGFPRTPAQTVTTAGTDDVNFPARNGFDGATIRGFGMRAQVDF
jgi:phosphate-selective porin